MHRQTPSFSRYVDANPVRTRFHTQVTGRIPPDGKWFYFRERSGSASMAIYPADRYPFAPAGSKATAGWDATSLGDEPDVEWGYDCDTPDDPGDLTELLVFRFIDSGAVASLRNLTDHVDAPLFSPSGRSN